MELKTQMSKKTLYSKLYSPQKDLHESWRHVYSNASKSKSRETRYEAQEYKENELNNMYNLARRLREKKFKFKPEKPTPRKKGKTYRPLVKPPIENRIAQRRMLEVLQSVPSIKELLKTENSFGGIEGRGVKDAIHKVTSLVEQGYTCFLKTDIENFYGSIPKDHLFSIMSDLINDSDLIELLIKAVNVEVQGIESLGLPPALYPTEETGVLQGASLSTMLGNILLHEFDTALNEKSVVCIRYIDDILLLSNSSRRLKAAFSNAERILKPLGLKLYDLSSGGHKAGSGWMSSGVEFLGCEIKNGIVKPSKKSRDHLLEEVDGVIYEGYTAMCAGKHDEATLRHVLTDLNNLIKGWGHAYSFCNEEKYRLALDKHIDKRLDEFFTKRWLQLKRKASRDPFYMRRLLGVPLLQDIE